MSDESVNLFAQQEANIRRSRWLIALFILFFAWLGFGGDWVWYEWTRAAPPAERHTVPWFGLVLSVIGAGIATFAWKKGPERVLWSTGARELTTPARPEEERLVNVVDEMAIASGLPRPRIWIVPDLDPNAFATGRDPQSSHIAVTEGLLNTLSRDELQAVVAHEMGHVQNLDVRLMTLLAALVGAVALMADGMGRMMRFGRLPIGSGSGSGGSRKKNDLGPLLIVVLVLWIISWLLAPLITRMLAMAVSRRREYLADAMGAQFTRNPGALASALEKIEAAPEATAAIKGGTAHLCIADPLGRGSSLREGKLADWFGTHPPMTVRIARLKAMAYQDQKRQGTFVPAGDQGIRNPESV
jgi:heat shock protein HtpX